jgi:hypothetical protein
MKAVVIFGGYVLIGAVIVALTPSSESISIGAVISGALLGASLGVGEFNDRTSPLVSNIIGIISAILVFSSMVVLYFISENSSIAFIVLGLILAGAFYYAITRE